MEQPLKLNPCPLLHTIHGGIKGSPTLAPVHTNITSHTVTGKAPEHLFSVHIAMVFSLVQLVFSVLI